MKPEMLDEYDFTKSVRGKYAARYAQGTNLVRLEPDVASMFPNDAAVNQALRLIGEIAKLRTKETVK